MATTRENSSVSLAKTSSSTERRSLMFNRSNYPGFHQAFYGKGDDEVKEGGPRKSKREMNQSAATPRRSKKKEKHGEDAVKRGRRKSKIKRGLLHSKGKKDEGQESSASLQEYPKDGDGHSSNFMYRPDKERKLDPAELNEDEALLLSGSHQPAYDTDEESGGYDLEFEEYWQETNDDIAHPTPVRTGFERGTSGRLQQNLDEHQEELNRKIYGKQGKGKKTVKLLKGWAKKQKKAKDPHESGKGKSKKSGRKMPRKFNHPNIDKLESMRKNFKPSMNLLHHKMGGVDDEETEEGHELVL